MSNQFNQNVLPIFSIPLYKFEIGSLAYELRNSVEQLNFVRSKNNFISNDNNPLLKKDFLKLKNVIYKNLKIFIYDVLCYEKIFKFKISDSWAYITKPNEESTIHNHCYSLFSGVVYLSTSSDDSITFFNPMKNSLSSFDSVDTIIHPENDKFNMYNSLNYTSLAKTGSGLIFHSNLLHKIDKNNSSVDRVSFAFNVVPTGLISNIETAKLTYFENNVEVIE